MASKQLRWQRKMQSQGRCRLCGSDMGDDTRVLCRRCQRASTARNGDKPYSVKRMLGRPPQEVREDVARERIRLLRTAVKLINHDGLTIAEAAKRIGRSYTWLATRLGWHAVPKDEERGSDGV